MVLSCTKCALHNHPSPVQLSIISAKSVVSSGGGLVFTAFTSAEENCSPVVTVHLWPHLSTLPCRYPPPSHLADTPHPPPCRYPPHPCCLALICTFHTQPCRLCFLSLQLASVYIIQNLGLPAHADVYKVQGVDRGKELWRD